MPRKPSKKAGKRRTKPITAGGGYKYIEKCGSPILRKNIAEKYEDKNAWMLDLEAHRIVTSQGWNSYCEKAFFVYRLMHKKEALAIAANQLNYSYPAFIWTYKGKFEILLMPKITIIEPFEEETWEMGMEGCLSIAEGNKAFGIRRAKRILLDGYDHFGNAIETRALSGFEARICQHECDHLSGRMIIDHISDIEKEEYLESIRRRN